LKESPISVTLDIILQTSLSAWIVTHEVRFSRNIRKVKNEFQGAKVTVFNEKKIRWCQCVKNSFTAFFAFSERLELRSVEDRFKIVNMVFWEELRTPISASAPSFASGPEKS